MDRFMLPNGRIAYLFMDLWQQCDVVKWFMARSIASVNIQRWVETSYSHQEADPHRRLSLPQGGADVGKPKLLVLLEMGWGRWRITEVFGKNLGNIKLIYLKYKNDDCAPDHQILVSASDYCLILHRKMGMLTTKPSHICSEFLFLMRKRHWPYHVIRKKHDIILS